MYCVILPTCSNKEELTVEKLSVARVLVMCGPREKYTATEIETLKQYLEKGGSLLVTLGEGGEAKHGTNINYLLEQFGMSINSGMAIQPTCIYVYRYLYILYPQQWHACRLPM